MLNTWTQILRRSVRTTSLATLLVAGALTHAMAQQPVLKGGIVQSESASLAGLTGAGAENLQNDQKKLDAMSAEDRAKHQNCEALIQNGVQLVKERDQAIDVYQSSSTSQASKTQLHAKIDSLGTQIQTLEAEIEHDLDEPVSSPAPAPARTRPSGGQTAPTPTRATTSTPYVPIVPSVPAPSKTPEPAPKPEPKTAAISKEQQSPSPETGAQPGSNNVTFYVSTSVKLQTPNNPQTPAWHYNDSSIDLEVQIPKGFSGELNSGKLAQQDKLSVVKYVTGKITPDPNRSGNYLFEIQLVQDLWGNSLHVLSIRQPGQTDMTAGSTIPLSRSRYNF